MKAASKSKILTIQDVKDLGAALILTSDAFPMQYVTERDFFPLVITYLSGRVPGIKTEVATGHGRIDFQLNKSSNPTWLELAVQPRHFVDKNNENIHLPGYARVSLTASQNRSELKKLMKVKTGKTRFLLLLDLNGGYGSDLSALKASYTSEARRFVRSAASRVRLVYVSRSVSGTFVVP